MRAAAAVTVLVLAALLSACGRSGEPGGGYNPVAAVQDFVVDGVVDGNGFEACQYLTPAEKRAATRRADAGACPQAFDAARLNLGAHPPETESQVRHLAAHATVDGDRAYVRLQRGDLSVRFRLVKADAGEQEEFLPPNTEWRIASGVVALIP